MPLPVMSNAEPWIGSNIDGKRRSGSRLAVGPRPSEPDKRARQIGQDVGVQVGRDDHVQGRGPQHHARGHGVDQLLVGRHLRELPRQLGEGLVPQHHAVTLGVRLGDQREPAPRPRARQCEGKAHDPGAAGAGEHGELGADLLGQAAMHPAPGAGVFALGVLAHDDPVEVAGPDPTQRAGYAGQQPRRAHVGVLIEPLADRETEAPERDVVRNIGRADRAEINGIERAQPIEAVRGHHATVPAMVFRAPVECLSPRGAARASAPAMPPAPRARRRSPPARYRRQGLLRSGARPPLITSSDRHPRRVVIDRRIGHGKSPVRRSAVSAADSCARPGGAGKDCVGPDTRSGDAERPCCVWSLACQSERVVPAAERCASATDVPKCAACAQGTLAQLTSFGHDNRRPEQGACSAGDRLQPRGRPGPSWLRRRRGEVFCASLTG